MKGGSVRMWRVANYFLMLIHSIQVHSVKCLALFAWPALLSSLISLTCCGNVSGQFLSLQPPLSIYTSPPLVARQFLKKVELMYKPLICIMQALMFLTWLLCVDVHSKCCLFERFESVLFFVFCQLCIICLFRKCVFSLNEICTKKRFNQ